MLGPAVLGRLLNGLRIDCSPARVPQFVPFAVFPTRVSTESWRNGPRLTPSGANVEQYVGRGMMVGVVFHDIRRWGMQGRRLDSLAEHSQIRQRGRKPWRS